MKSTTIKLIALLLTFLACSCILNTNEMESYLPSIDALKKDVVINII